MDLYCSMKPSIVFTLENSFIFPKYSPLVVEELVFRKIHGGEHKIPSSSPPSKLDLGGVKCVGWFHGKGICGDDYILCIDNMQFCV